MRHYGVRTADTRAYAAIRDDSETDASTNAGALPIGRVPRPDPGLQVRAQRRIAPRRVPAAPVRGVCVRSCVRRDVLRRSV